jgi:hypothetical protein
MTPEQFAYWLQGFFELTEGNQLSEKQVQVVKDHLQITFKKVTPNYTQPPYQQPNYSMPTITC